MCPTKTLNNKKEGKKMIRSKVFLVLSFVVIISMLIIAMPAVPVMAQGSLSLTPASGPPGTSVTIQGSGFENGQSVNVRRVKSLDSDDDIVSVFTRTVGNSGSFSESFVIPSQPRGDYEFSAWVSEVEVDSQTFTVYPEFNVANSVGRVGEKIGISGRGFKEGGLISIYFDGSIIQQPIAGDNGNFSTSFTVPKVVQGPHPMRCKDPSGFADDVEFMVNPKISIDKTNVSIGSQLGVSGNGFAGSSTITFSLDGTDISKSATTDTYGTFTDINITIPTLQGGDHTLKVTDEEGNSDTIDVSTTQSMSISPQNGVADTAITVSGSGFAANKTITIQFKGTTIATTPATVSSDANGNFTATAAAPKYAAGTYEISATDGTNTRTANFTISNTANIDKTSGTVGSSIPISGNGFTAGAIITIKFDDVAITTAKTDANGAFSSTFQVPSSTAGQHKVTITDGLNPVNANFTTTASAQISNASGAGTEINGDVGSDITVSGNAFTPGAQVVVSYDSTQAAIAAVDSNGSFSTTFKAPVSKGGNHTVTASDGTNKMSFTFIMDSTPPPAPGLLSPLKDIQADPLSKFQWSAVADPSGVAYTLQVARDPGFNSIFIEVSNLTDTSYQLTAAQALPELGKDKPYYWKVSATDNASNVGPWSLTQTFYVGSSSSPVNNGDGGGTGTGLPSWALYFIYAVAAIVLLGIGFFVGRRTGRA
jgi:hypothetical protein